MTSLVLQNHQLGCFMMYSWWFDGTWRVYKMSTFCHSMYIFNVKYCLRASSPIWASEASLARTRERAVKPRGAEERTPRSRVLVRLAQIGQLARGLRKVVVVFIGLTFVLLVHHSRKVPAQRSLRRPVGPAEGRKQVLRRQIESEPQWYETPRQEKPLGKNRPKSHYEKKRMRRFGKITS